MINMGDRALGVSLIGAFCLLLCTLLSGGDIVAGQSNYTSNSVCQLDSSALLDAIRCVESNGDVCAIDDNGSSVGAYQITRGYYDEAVSYNYTLHTSIGDYTDLWGEGSEQFSESVIRAYMCRYATRSRLGQNATNEDLARIHNGGPDGWRNSNTEDYWRRVSAQLSSGSCTAAPSTSYRCTPRCRPGQCCQRDQDGNYRCFCLQEFADTPGHYTSRPCENCSTAGVDLMFVLDRSRSIGSYNFGVIQRFVNTFVSRLEIGPTRSQVGVIVFNLYASVEFSLTRYPYYSSLASAVNRLSYSRYSYYRKDTSQALNLLANQGFIGARPLNQGVPRIAIVVTDGVSDSASSNATARAADMLHQNKSITVYAVGIGNASLDELNTIASTRNGAKFVRFISGFGFDRIQEDLYEQTCTASAVVEVAAVSVRRTIERNTMVYLEYRVPSNGLTVKANVEQGNIALCGSKSLQHPDCSYSPTYDWKMETEIYDDIFISRGDSNNNRKRSLSERQTTEGRNETVFVTIEGLDSQNTFELNTTFGDTTATDYTAVIIGSIVGALVFLLLFITTGVICGVFVYKRVLKSVRYV